MSDNKTPSDLDLIASMNDLARQIGEMEPDDPLRAVRLKELYTLRERSKSFETERNKIMRYDNGCAPQRPETQSSRSRLSFMTLSVRIPLREYDDFVKALDASSRAAGNP